MDQRFFENVMLLTIFRLVLLQYVKDTNSNNDE